MQEEQDQQELAENFILPALESSKDIQRHLYTDFTSGGGMLRKVKNKAITKIANITRNTVEKSFMRQQKFNDNILKLASYLLKENKKLKEELKQLKQQYGK